MNTFEEYIAWVRSTQPTLDNAWSKAEDEKSENHLPVYGKLLAQILGKVRFIHPSTDNGQFYVNLDLEKSLDLLKETGWNVKQYIKNKNIYSVAGGEELISDYYRLTHEEGLASIQLFNSPADLLFYFGDKNEVASRFTSPEQAKYLAKIPFETKPDERFSVKTILTINPYGGEWNAGTRRDQHRIMEETVIQLMERMIRDNVPALFQNYVGFHCIINPPLRT